MDKTYCVLIHGNAVWCFDDDEDAKSLAQNIWEETSDDTGRVEVEQRVFLDDTRRIVFTAGVDPSPYDSR